MHVVALCLVRCLAQGEWFAMGDLEEFNIDDKDCPYLQVSWEHRLFLDDMGDGNHQLTDIVSGANAVVTGYELVKEEHLALLAHIDTEEQLEPAVALKSDLVMCKLSGD